MPTTVAIISDGIIVAATLEERFTREKNDDRWPENAILSCLETSNMKMEDLDYVAVASYFTTITGTILKKYDWTVEDYLKEQNEIWKPALVEKSAKKSHLEVFQDRIDLKRFPNNICEKYLYDGSDLDWNKNRPKEISPLLGIDKENIHLVEHHRAHAAYSYYASHFRNERILSLTIDGWGDGKNATIGEFLNDGTYVEHFATDQCFIGRIYRYMTLLLGMKPNEHEFKVMGLAPYGKKKYAQRALDVFRSTLYVDGIEFKWKTKPEDSYFWFAQRLEGVRFDNIAFALQTWVEELLSEWVTNAVDKFDISKLVISGGVAMNIKAMGKIAELECVDDLFVGGSASDESLSIGSAYCLAEDMSRKNSLNWNSSKIPPIESLYLGPNVQNEHEQEVVNLAKSVSLSVMNKPSAKEIAELLVEGKVLARCVGRMEFGQRSLGNRSILADPSDLNVKDKINSMIKSRDFWMPFAPIILDRFVDEYLINPKKIKSPHMTIGFETTVKGYKSMIAACHPADKTARAQILSRSENPLVYELIEEFEKLTGRGALLNTSFNLHGYPIVNTPIDAFNVFQNSGLDGLIFKNYLVLK